MKDDVSLLLRVEREPVEVRCCRDSLLLKLVVHESLIVHVSDQVFLLKPTVDLLVAFTHDLACCVDASGEG